MLSVWCFFLACLLLPGARWTVLLIVTYFILPSHPLHQCSPVSSVVQLPSDHEFRNESKFFTKEKQYFVILLFMHLGCTIHYADWLYNNIITIYKWSLFVVMCLLFTHSTWATKICTYKWTREQTPSHVAWQVVTLRQGRREEKVSTHHQYRGVTSPSTTGIVHGHLQAPFSEMKGHPITPLAWRTPSTHHQWVRRQPPFLLTPISTLPPWVTSASTGKHYHGDTYVWKQQISYETWMNVSYNYNTL